MITFREILLIGLVQIVLLMIWAFVLVGTEEENCIYEDDGIISKNCTINGHTSKFNYHINNCDGVLISGDTIYFSEDSYISIKYMGVIRGFSRDTLYFFNGDKFLYINNKNYE